MLCSLYDYPHWALRMHIFYWLSQETERSWDSLWGKTWTCFIIKVKTRGRISLSWQPTCNWRYWSFGGQGEGVRESVVRPTKVLVGGVWRARYVLQIRRFQLHVRPAIGGFGGVVARPRLNNYFLIFLLTTYYYNLIIINTHTLFWGCFLFC